MGNSLLQGISEGIFHLRLGILASLAQNSQILRFYQGMSQGIAGIPLQALPTARLMAALCRRFHGGTGN